MQDVEDARYAIDDLRDEVDDLRKNVQALEEIRDNLRPYVNLEGLGKVKQERDDLLRQMKSLLNALASSHPKHDTHVKTPKGKYEDKPCYTCNNIWLATNLVNNLSDS